MDDNDKEYINKFFTKDLKKFLPFWCLYLILYLIFKESIPFFYYFIIIPLGLYSTTISCVFISLFLFFEVAYHLKLMIAIVINLIILIFLPILSLIILDPINLTFYFFQGNLVILYTTLLCSYLAVICCFFIWTEEGYLLRNSKIIKIY